MSIENMKGKKGIIILAALALVAVAVVIALLPSDDDKYVGEPEVISKRVKINIDEGAVQSSQEALNQPLAVETLPEAKPQEEVSTAAAPAPPQDPGVGQPIKVVMPEKDAAPAEKPSKKAELRKKAAEKKAAAKRLADKKAAEKKKAATKTKKDTDVSKALAAKPWALNIASFPNAKEAKALAESLKSAGYNVYITEFMKDGSKWSRVRVGFFSTRDAAAAEGKKIEKKFRVQSAWIVKAAKDEAVGRIK